MKQAKRSSRSEPGPNKRIEGAACSKDIEYVYEVENRKAQEHSNRALKRVATESSEIFGGIDPRRRQEMADAGMIRPDMNAMANCPRQAINHEWPAIRYYQNQYIDDTVVGE